MDQTKRKRINQKENLPTEMGKLPPQAIELEEAVLGAILIENEALEKVIEFIRPEMFYKDQNGQILEAILSCRRKNIKIDILTVTQEAKALGILEIIGGAYYITQLTNRIASSANIEFHFRIVQQAYLKRELIRLSYGLTKEAYEDSSDFFDVKDKIEKALLALTANLGSNKFHTPNSLMEQVLGDNEVMIKNPGALLGVPSGFDDIDRLTGGWQKSDLIILAARPGMGKTAFVIQMGCNAATEHAKPVGVFSLEQPALQIFKRLCSQITEIPLKFFTSDGLDKDTLNILLRDTQALLKSKFIIDDTGGLTVMEIRSRARRMVIEFGIELLIIDYLQLISGGQDSKGNREQEISIISRSLKALAKELGIPVIALSQLSRQTENRPGGQKLPQLSDLRDSGAIEQDADMVMFIYRPEYYGIEVDADNEPTAGKAKIIIAKNRSGPLKNVDLRWKGECTKFRDYDVSYEEKKDTPADKSLTPNNNFLKKDDLPF